MTSPTRSRGHFHVMLLGPFVLTRDGTSLSNRTWPRRTGSLFRLLALSPDKRCSREEVIETLWPASSSHAGHSNLRCTLHHLRRVLGNSEPPIILANRLSIALNPEYTWEMDLERFLEMAHEERDDISKLELAAALYRGDPLYEDRYQDWTIPIRERVHQDWRALCLRLARAYIARDAIERAVWWFERLLESDPLDEEAVRGLMGSLSRLGQRPKAVRTYQRFERQLRKEMDIGPDSETHALFEKVRASGDVKNATRPPNGARSAERALPVVPRKALTCTAVLGQEFDYPSLEAMWGVDREALTYLGTLSLAEGKFEQGRAYREHAVTTFERWGDPEALAWGISRLADVFYLLGNWSEAREKYAEAMDLVERLPAETHHASLPSVGLGILFMNEGRLEEAARYLDQGMMLAVRTAHIWALEQARVAMAEMDLLEGNAARSLARLRPRLAHSNPNISTNPPTVLARARLAMGDMDGAGEVVQQGLELAIRGGSPSDQSEWLCVQGSILTHQRRWEEAGSMFEEAAQLAHGMPYPHAEARALQEYGWLYARKGAPDKARRRLDEALRIFRRLGARPNIEQVEALSEQLAPSGLSSVR